MSELHAELKTKNIVAEFILRNSEFKNKFKVAEKFKIG